MSIKMIKNIELDGKNKFMQLEPMQLRLSIVEWTHFDDVEFGIRYCIQNLNYKKASIGTLETFDLPG